MVTTHRVPFSLTTQFKKHFCLKFWFNRLLSLIIQRFINHLVTHNKQNLLTYFAKCCSIGKL